MKVSIGPDIESFSSPHLISCRMGIWFQDPTFAKERGQSHLDQSNLILPALAVLPTRRTGMIHSTFQIPHHVDLARPPRAETEFVLVELGNAIFGDKKSKCGFPTTFTYFHSE
jgi:hypothetical protein